MACKHKEVQFRKVKRISRDVLRTMRDGETLYTICQDYRAIESQKNLSYAFQKIAGCRFSCKSVGLNLWVTRKPQSHED